MSNRKDNRWINSEEYPFPSHHFQSSVGSVHYIDEGEGEPIIFVHGNLSWSFEFRKVIKKLSPKYRCIAIDLIGFGLSEKPFEWSYLPKEHSKVLEEFLTFLHLDNITLVVGDWGGPIGLQYAINYPSKVSKIVITNTWMWSVKYDWYYQGFSKFFGSWIGRKLIQKENFFVKVMIKKVYGNPKVLTEDIHAHYIEPLKESNDRKGNWTFAKEIVQSGPWLEKLWEQRGILKEKRILILWGLKDIAFREKELQIWLNEFPQTSVSIYPEVGHFLAEEIPMEMAVQIHLLMKSQ